MRLVKVLWQDCDTYGTIRANFPFLFENGGTLLVIGY